MLDWQRLTEHLPTLEIDFRDAVPFPHVCIDRACDSARLAEAVAAWPVESDAWRQSQRGKRGMGSLAAIPDPLKGLVGAFNSPPFVAFLERLTGIDGLQVDPAYGGGGLHEVFPGGTLPMHVDFNRLGPLYRRVNLLLYLNRDWQNEWNGALELRDDPKKPTIQRTLTPVFNRLVIFEASEKSWHGHPKELRCPEGVTRRSIAAYYYHEKPHPTYRGEDHSTVYVIPHKERRAAKRARKRGAK